MADYYFETDVTMFTGYDRILAECHIANFGKIVCSSKFHDVIEVEDAIHLIEEGLV